MLDPVVTHRLHDLLGYLTPDEHRTVSHVAMEFKTFQAVYHDRPVEFAAHCIQWRESETLTQYQQEILAALVTFRRVCVRSPHAAGKTTIAALAVLWFALTRDGEDFKIVTTASAWRQLVRYLWPEIHKWARRLRWDRIGRKPFDPHAELLTLNLKLSTGEAFAIASDVPDLIEGAHAATIFYIFDEAKVIPPKIWDAAEGALASGTCYTLAISTPGEPGGRFYEIQSRKPGYGDWWTRHVTLKEAQVAGRIDSSWVEDRRAQWGEMSAVYRQRVLGEFSSSEEQGVIPLAWVETAQERWHVAMETPEMVRQVSVVGVDVARSGEDRTVLAVRSNLTITELRRYTHGDTMATVGHVRGALITGGVGVIDVVGIGAGVYDRLWEQHILVEPFNAAAGTDLRDRSGELGFVNCRSAAWWQLRELLDPTSGQPVALPPDDLLTGDLTAPRWRVTSGGKIQLESKDEIRKRLGRSTDDGDAVVMAFWPMMQQAILPDDSYAADPYYGPLSRRRHDEHEDIGYTEDPFYADSDTAGDGRGFTRYGGER
jgi:hypothetical protein